MLKQFGYGSDLIIVKNSLKAVYETEKCVGCDKCVFICPVNAIEAQPLATPQISLKACKGCGACALVCPHLAIQLKGFEYELLSQKIQKYKAEANLKGISPLILVLCCQWAEFPLLDSIRGGFVRERAAIIEIPCFNGLDPVHILEAFALGFDGVLTVVCLSKNCKLEEGRKTSERNISALEKVLGKLNLANRFEVYTTSPKYVGDFMAKLDSFITKISSLPKMTSGR